MSYKKNNKIFIKNLSEEQINSFQKLKKYRKLVKEKFNLQDYYLMITLNVKSIYISRFFYLN